MVVSSDRHVSSNTTVRLSIHGGTAAMTQPVGMTWQVYDPRVYTTSMQQFPPHPPPPYAQQPLPPYAFAPPGMYPMAMQQPQLVYAPAPTVMPMLPQAVGQNSTRSSRDRKDMKKRTK